VSHPTVRIVHLPFYDDNPYQTLLMRAQRDLGHDVWEGGGGGNFLGVALRNWKADLIHFHWLHPYLLRDSAFGSILRASRFLLEVGLLKLLGAKIAWTIHNLENHDGQHAAIEWRFSKLFAKLCDRCYVHSAAAALAAASKFGIPLAKLVVIPHGNYIDAYPNRLSQGEARTELGLQRQSRVFLFLGRIEPYKGVFDLIDAFKRLPGDSILLLAGKIANPELLPEIEARIAGHPRIHLHARRIPDDQLQQFFNAADVVVFPFRKILTSGSLVLAMSFGKAVVAPQVASLQEILPDSGVCWFDPNEQVSLVEAMNEWGTRNVVTAGAGNLVAARDWDWKAIAKFSTNF
jgi:beta-1,4-mannosyltransferase